MDGVPTSGFRQYLVTVLVSLTTLNYGIVAGWLTPVVPFLKSRAVIGHVPLNEDMIAQAGSLVNGGALIGCFLWTGITNRLGRKGTSLLISLSYVISWSLLCFDSSLYGLYMARLFGGLGKAGILINTPLYVAEIATTRLKDRLVSFLVLSTCIGTTYALASGSLMVQNQDDNIKDGTIGFRVLNSVNLAIAIVSLLCTFYLPETPVYYLKHDKLNEARKSLMWLRYYRTDNKAHRGQLEMDLLALESTFLNKHSISPWRDLLIPSTRKTLFIGMGLILIQQTSGISVILMEALTYFKAVDKRSSPLITSKVSLIILALVQLPGAVASFYFANKYKRKSMLMSTNFCMALCLFTVGTFYCFILPPCKKPVVSINENDSVFKSYLFSNMPHSSIFSLIPVIFISLFMIIYLIAHPTYFIVLTEIFPVDTRHTCIGIMVIFQNIFVILLVLLYPLIEKIMETSGIFWMFSACQIVGIVFIYFFVPETRNKSIQGNVQHKYPQQHACTPI